MALGIAAALLGGYEAALRAMGHRPSVVDDFDLWANHRAAASNAGAGAVVLLGASRMHTNMDLGAFRSEYPARQFVQLAISGGESPVPILQNLAEDDDFRGGLVLVGVVENWLRDTIPSVQQDYAEHYERRTNRSRALDRDISAWLQERLVVVNPLVSPRGFLEGRWEKGFPAPSYVHLRADRMISADYSMVDLERKHVSVRAWLEDHYAKNPPPPPDAWLRAALMVQPFVQKIKDRGGDVVFIRMPSSGEHWRYDQMMFPKALYWDRFAAAVGARTVHFDEVPSLSSFYAPDWSHLDRKDAPHFTRALGAELARQGLLK